MSNFEFERLHWAISLVRSVITNEMVKICGKTVYKIPDLDATGLVSVATEPRRIADYM